jgi:hypothetical protein
MLAAGAQLRQGEGEVQYVWGQFLTDQGGDNVGQYGLHGTCQGVAGLALGSRQLGKFGARYERCLSGGTRALTDMLTRPLKALDARKTFKVAELLGALSASEGPGAAFNRVLELLVAGARRGGWTHDLQAPIADGPDLWPTTYVIDALSYVADPTLFSEMVTAAVDCCLAQLEANHNLDDLDRAALFRLTACMSRYELSLPDLVERLARFYQQARGGSVSLDAQQRYEYRIRSDGNAEEHAFCTAPSGLAQLRSDLWLFRRSGGDGNHDELSERVQAFVAGVHRTFDAGFADMRRLSYAIRLLSDFGHETDTLVQASGAPLNGALWHEYSVAEPLRATLSGVPADSRNAREKDYQAALSDAGEADQVVHILDQLTDGYSGAHVDLCEVTHGSGAAQLLQVFKLDRKDSTEREIKGITAARLLIPKEFLAGLYRDRDYDVNHTDNSFIRYEFASGLLQPGRTLSFLKYLDSEAEPSRIVAVVDRLFEQGLASAHMALGTSQMTLTGLCHSFDKQRNVPPGRFLSDLREGVFALRRNVQLCRELPNRSRIILRFPFLTALDPISYWDRIGEMYFPAANSKCVHGDLNPRNILLVQRQDAVSHDPVLIDFQRFGGPAPLATDYCRLEAGIHVKAMASVLRQARGDGELEEQLLRYVQCVSRGGDGFAQDHVLLGQEPLPIELKKLTRVVAAIRRAFLQSAPLGVRADHRGYFGVLSLYLLNYLKPTYEHVLSSEQKLFSFYMASHLLTSHFIHPGLKKR